MFFQEGRPLIYSFTAKKLSLLFIWMIGNLYNNVDMSVYSDIVNFLCSLIGKFNHRLTPDTIDRYDI